MKQVGPWMFNIRGVGFSMAMRGKLNSLGVFPNKRIQKVLRWQSMDAQLRDIAFPLAVATWDVEGGGAQILSSALAKGTTGTIWNRHATLAQAICASVAVPGLITPILWRGRTLTGGAALWPHLADALREMDADSFLRIRVLSVREANVDALSIALSAELPNGADEIPTLHVPLPERSGAMDFSSVEQFFDIGYKVGKQALPKILHAPKRGPGKVLPFLPVHHQ